MPQIDYFFSTISPFTYLAGDRFQAVAEKHGADVVFKPLDILGLFGRTGGVPPGQRHPSRQEYRLQELRRGAAKAGPVRSHLLRHRRADAFGAQGLFADS